MLPQHQERAARQPVRLKKRPRVGHGVDYAGGPGQLGKEYKVVFHVVCHVSSVLRRYILVVIKVCHCHIKVVCPARVQYGKHIGRGQVVGIAVYNAADPVRAVGSGERACILPACRIKNSVQAESRVVVVSAHHYAVDGHQQIAVEVPLSPHRSVDVKVRRVRAGRGGNSGAAGQKAGLGGGAGRGAGMRRRRLLLLLLRILPGMPRIHREGAGPGAPAERAAAAVFVVRVVQIRLARKQVRLVRHRDAVGGGYVHGYNVAVEPARIDGYYPGREHLERRPYGVGPPVLRDRSLGRVVVRTKDGRIAGAHVRDNIVHAVQVRVLGAGHVKADRRWRRRRGGRVRDAEDQLGRSADRRIPRQAQRALVQGGICRAVQRTVQRAAERLRRGRPDGGGGGGGGGGILRRGGHGRHGRQRQGQGGKCDGGNGGNAVRCGAQRPALRGSRAPWGGHVSGLHLPPPPTLPPLRSRRPCRQAAHSFGCGPGRQGGQLTFAGGRCRSRTLCSMRVAAACRRG